MTRAAKITYLTALLIGLSVGTSLGFLTSTENLASYYNVRRMAAPEVLRDFSYIQYRRADLGHARTALLTFANFLEEMETLHREKRQELDLAATYTRLALLADAAHNQEESHTYMAKTRYWYAKGGRAEVSDSEMKAAVQRMDTRMDELRITK
jgi:hypothetical protein